MADNYKILAQEKAASTEIQTSQPQAKAVYTVPAGTQTSISSVSVTNVSSSNATYKLGVVKSENVTSENTIFDLELEPAYTEEVPNTEYSAIFDGLFSTTKDFLNYDPTSDPYGMSSYTLSARTTRNWSAVGEFSVILGVRNGSQTYLLSQNSGQSYTSYTTPDSYAVSSIVWSNGLFILLTGSGNIYTSFTGRGTDWTLRSQRGSNPTPLRLLKVKVINTDYVVATGGNAYITYSSNGTNWSTSYLGYSASGYPFYPSEVTWSNGYWYLLDGYYDGSLYRASTLTGARTLVPQIKPYSWYTSDYRVLGCTPDFTSLVVLKSGAVYVGRGGNTIFSQISYPDSDNRYYYHMDTTSESFYVYSGYNNYAAVSRDNGSTLEVLPFTKAIYKNTLYIEEADPIIIEHPAVIEQVPIQIISDKATIIPNRTIEPKAVDEIVGGIVLSEGDQIRVYSDSEDVLIHVYGVELS